jgi:hypothetical protein
MRARNSTKGKPLLHEEYIPVELRRITEEEFEMWNHEPCRASAD